jgi:hypothetical protein
MIHEQAKSRVIGGGTQGEGLLHLFEQMAEDAEERGLEAGHIIVSYFEEGDDFKVGTWVPELHLMVQKVTDDEATNESYTP